MIIIRKHLEVYENTIEMNQLQIMMAVLLIFLLLIIIVLFKFKLKIKSQTGNDGKKYEEINVPLKYLSNF